MALAKMVGLEVTPRMPLATRPARVPSWSQSRRRLSSQGLWPCSVVEVVERGHGSFRRCGAVGQAGAAPTPAVGGPGGDVLGGEAELVHGHLARGRGPEVVDAHRGVGVAVPAEGAGRLDGQAGHPGGQHLVPVVVGLARRTGPRTGSDTTRAAMPVGGQQVGGGQAQLDLAAGADQDHLGRPVRGLAQDVAAPGHAVGGPLGRLGQDRELLSGQDQGGGPVAVDGDPPGLGRLVGVGRPDHPQVGHGPHRGQLLDGLVGGTVLAQADGVVGPRVDDVDVGEGGHPYRAPHVVAEDEEGAADRQGPAMGGHAVHDPAHAVLADAVVDQAAAGVGRLTGPWRPPRPCRCFRSGRRCRG